MRGALDRRRVPAFVLEPVDLFPGWLVSSRCAMVTHHAHSRARGKGAAGDHAESYNAIHRYSPSLDSVTYGLIVSTTAGPK
jgi:hypothetical protein